MAIEDLPGVYQISLLTVYFLQNGLTKIYKLGLEMKKICQGYIESENFGQSRILLHSAIEDGSVYRVCIKNRYKLNIFCKTA